MVRDLGAAKVRQRYVLNRMVIADKITPEEAGAAFARDVTIVPETPPPPETSAPEFADLVEGSSSSSTSRRTTRTCCSAAGCA
jgi:membrane peptidoglycan carboxypeptidase